MVAAAVDTLRSTTTIPAVSAVARIILLVGVLAQGTPMKPCEWFAVVGHDFAAATWRTSATSATAPVKDDDDGPGDRGRVPGKSKSCWCEHMRGLCPVGQETPNLHVDFDVGIDLVIALDPRVEPLNLVRCELVHDAPLFQHATPLLI